LTYLRPRSERPFFITHYINKNFKNPQQQTVNFTVKITRNQNEKKEKPKLHNAQLKAQLETVNTEGAKNQIMAEKNSEDLPIPQPTKPTTTHFKLKKK